MHQSRLRLKTAREILSVPVASEVLRLMGKVERGYRYRRCRGRVRQERKRLPKVSGGSWNVSDTVDWYPFLFLEHEQSRNTS